MSKRRDGLILRQKFEATIPIPEPDRRVLLFLPPLDMRSQFLEKFRPCFCMKRWLVHRLYKLGLAHLTIGRPELI